MNKVTPRKRDATNIPGVMITSVDSNSNTSRQKKSCERHLHMKSVCENKNSKARKNMRLVHIVRVESKSRGNEGILEKRKSNEVREKSKRNVRVYC